VLKIYFAADTDPAYLRQIGIYKSKQELQKPVGAKHATKDLSAGKVIE
jgi:hypothetical protein